MANDADGQPLRDDGGLGDTEATGAFVEAGSEQLTRKPSVGLGEEKQDTKCSELFQGFALNEGTEQGSI